MLLSDVLIILKHVGIQEVMVPIQLQTLHLIHDWFEVPEEQVKHRLGVRFRGLGEIAVEAAGGIRRNACRGERRSR